MNDPIHNSETESLDKLPISSHCVFILYRSMCACRLSRMYLFNYCPAEPEIIFLGIHCNHNIKFG